MGQYWNEDHREDVPQFTKRGCVFPMVIWPAFRMGQYRVNDNPYHAPQFIERRWESGLGDLTEFFLFLQKNVQILNWILSGIFETFFIDYHVLHCMISAQFIHVCTSPINFSDEYKPYESWIRQSARDHQLFTNGFFHNDLSEIKTVSLKNVKNARIMRISQFQPFSCLDRFGNGMGSTVNGTSDFDNSVFTNDHRVSNPIWPPEIVHAHYVSSISLFVLFGLVSIGKSKNYTVRIGSSNGTLRSNGFFLIGFGLNCFTWRNIKRNP